MHVKKINERHDSYLPESLTQSHIDLSNLSPFQKILLIADGTLTNLLEAYLSEELHVVKLSEEMVSITQDIPPLDLKVGRKVVNRKILLQGSRSLRNWLYADSIIVPDRLEKQFRDQLLLSSMPIGKLWLEHKTETFKEIIISAREPAGELSKYFDINPEDRLLYRTYRVFSNRKPIMMITEKFPELCFSSALVSK